MPRIKRLPVHIANQIAAGEVVERPSSVVKELVENALDAGASSIEVRLLSGGKRLIEVRDNGLGMSREDLVLSVEPHATSKIETEQDLEAISTLGFRGEALASIGAVSKLSISSRQRNSTEGWKIEVVHGRVGEVRPQACPEGTLVTVQDLFMNTPARAKFLKTDQTEYARCLKVVQLFCAAWPQVDFRLKREKKTVLSCRAGLGPVRRLEPLLGKSIVKELVPVHGQGDGLGISGFVASPDRVRLSRRHFYFFLNRRPVSSPVLWKALNDSMRGLLVKGNHPAGALFIEIDPILVDVNVHPTKSEVRFERPNDIYRLVFHSVRRALEAEEGHFLKADTQGEVKKGEGPFAKQDEGGHRRDAPSNERLPFPLPWEACSKGDTGSKQGSMKEVRDGALGLSYGSGSVSQNESWHPPRFPVQETGKAEDFHVIGQYARSFILFEKDDRLVILDQHAVHEALIFKGLREEFITFGRLERQQLLVPKVVEVGLDRMENLQQAKMVLERLGLVVEGFGESQVAVRSVPSSFFQKEMDQGLLEKMVLRALEEPDVPPEEHLREFAARLSCSLAIKAGQALSAREMETLVAQCLDEGVRNCPHGRPVMVELERDELYARFFRK